MLFPQVYILRQEVVEMTVDDREIVDTGSDHKCCVYLNREAWRRRREKKVSSGRLMGEAVGMSFRKQWKRNSKDGRSGIRKWRSG